MFDYFTGISEIPAENNSIVYCLRSSHAVNLSIDCMCLVDDESDDTQDNGDTST